MELLTTEEESSRDIEVAIEPHESVSPEIIQIAKGGLAFVSLRLVECLPPTPPAFEDTSITAFNECWNCPTPNECSAGNKKC